MYYVYPFTIVIVNYLVVTNFNLLVAVTAIVVKATLHVPVPSVKFNNILSLLEIVLLNEHPLELIAKSYIDTTPKFDFN